jgi:D-alanyl-D-alanine carboxypeptidase/D-alanyl-D-alanine-endopeptidase (penicillin-binding protein 4)
VTRTRRAVVALLVVTAGAFAVLAVGAAADPSRDPTAEPLRTPVWSPRRLPQPIVDAVGAQRLQAAIDSEFAGVDVCLVVTSRDGRSVVAERQPDAALIPASSQKLFIAAAALDVLGPEHRFETTAVAAGGPNDGTLEQLWLVGGGDPVLATPEFAPALSNREYYEDTPIVATALDSLAESIVATGVERIPGGIHGDDSRYESLRYLPTWKDTYRTDGQVGPVGALTVNFGFSTVEPRPVPVDDPAVFAASELQRLLETRGVEVGAPAGRSPAPADAEVLATVMSPPLREITGELLRSSGNGTAEMLTRELGVRVSDEGSTAAGTEAVVATIAALGVRTDGLTLIDGSGLDRGNRASCAQLIGALDPGRRPEFASLWEGLAVAGAGGTLYNRLLDTPLQGRLRGKTGSLDGVGAIAGLVDVNSPLRFAFIVNGPFDEDEGDALEDRAATIVGQYPDAPPADVLVPTPAGTGG